MMMISFTRYDKLGLIYKTSKKNEVAVNTAVGKTDRVTIPEIVAQGGTWGLMLCLNSVKWENSVKRIIIFFLIRN